MLLWHVLVPVVHIPRMLVTQSHLARLLCSHWVSWVWETPPSATDDDMLSSCLTSSSSSPTASTHTYTFPHVCTIYILLKLYQVSRTRIWKKKHDGWGYHWFGSMNRGHQGQPVRCICSLVMQPGDKLEFDIDEDDVGQSISTYCRNQWWIPRFKWRSLTSHGTRKAMTMLTKSGKIVEQLRKNHGWIRPRSGEIMLDTSSKVTQCCEIDVELLLWVGAHQCRNK